jgi:hypothetical protein
LLHWLFENRGLVLMVALAIAAIVIESRTTEE